MFFEKKSQKSILALKLTLLKTTRYFFCYLYLKNENKIHHTVYMAVGHSPAGTGG
jgi:hypothetical protein